MRRLLVFALLVTAGFLVAPAPPAMACSCASMDMNTHVAQADRIFVGTIAAVGKTERGGGVLKSVPFTVDVSLRIQGDTARREVVWSPRGEASCGIDEEVGRPMVFFVKDEPDGASTGLCAGTQEARADYVTEVEAVAGPGRPVIPAGSGPAPATSAPGSTSPGEATDRQPPADEGTPWGPIVLAVAAVALVGAGVVLLRRGGRSEHGDVLP
ncbi:hypothetical protein N802_01405 [Knoellia sinensis KCTC 19936]|uniref:Tissue inhibitor of metalloproteinase n=1 Tax=Knoellia sinensis KCTC 19936 TaxID=1385520 RepID=A0A0A0JG49_9MICO|nr:hypothetical protein [Knoellia sinensis]KGN35027.1 hypothetical protein N802_01405 [Knoellia sinensis KCTC 19936]